VEDRLSTRVMGRVLLATGLFVVKNVVSRFFNFSCRATIANTLISTSLLLHAHVGAVQAA
jgi:hypothetical protein